jgi:mannose/fructose/N-acetylgalactosamine-specific phosphotransferase system component IIB
MKKVVLTRIDDRLIHGQVITAWVKYIKADAILIVDEELANNVLMQRIYKAAAPTNIEMFICNNTDAVTFLKTDDAKIKEVIILVKIPQVIETLISSDINITHVILGGIGSNHERKKLIRNVFTSKAENESFRRLLDLNCRVEFQLVPDEKATDISKLI